MKNSQKGFVVPLLIAITVLALLGIGGWTYVNNQKIESENKVNVFQENSTSTENNKNKSIQENAKTIETQVTSYTPKETSDLNKPTKVLTKTNVFKESCENWRGFFGTKDMCIVELSATYSKNIDNCKKIAETGMRDFCITSVAEYTNNPSLCLSITNLDKTSCYFDVARFNKDTKACLLISEKIPSQNCVEQVQSISN